MEYFVANEDATQVKVDIPGIELYSYTNPTGIRISDILTIHRNANAASISSYKMMSKVNLADILDVDSVTDNGDGSFFVAIAGQFNPILDRRYEATMGYCTHYNLIPNTGQDQAPPPNTLLLNSNLCLIIDPTISVEETKELISSRAVELVYVSIPSSIKYTDNDGQWVQQIGQLTYGHNPVIIISSKESDLAPDGTINYYIWEGNSNGN
jgi:hypothetical protein